MEQCARITDTSIFGKCHDKIDPTSYVMDCRTESMGCAFGGDCQCLCTSVARYARDCCMAHGICPQWRDRYFCRKFDPEKILLALKSTNLLSNCLDPSF